MNLLRKQSAIALLLSITMTPTILCQEIDFKKQVLPILNSHCAKCHGPKKQEARIRLDNLSTDLINNRAAAEHWHEVRNVLNAGEMPPEDAKQLSPAQRKTLLTWIELAIKQAVDANRSTGRRVVLRRLNRVEYQNTMQDLLGLEMDYSRDLPPDAVSADGFTNNGQSLQMSPTLLEYYLDAARRALDRVIVSGPPPKVYHYEFKTSNVKNWLGGTQRSNRLQRKQNFLATMKKDYPESGEFLIKVKLTPELKADKGFPLLEVSVGYRPDTKILFREAGVVEIKSDREQTFEFRGRLENHPLPVRGQGKFPGLVVRVRNLYDDGSPLPKGKKNQFPNEDHLPAINIQSVEFHGPVFQKWPPASHRAILFDSESRSKNEAQYVHEVLARFMTRAYRRPVDESEVAKMTTFFEAIRPDFPSFEEAIRETLAMVLIQPNFLYLLEPAGNAKRQVGDWELASRLSFFLWSTMPDDELIRKAKAKTLSDSKVLAEQVERMLFNQRADQFFKLFTEQWLHLNSVNSVAVSQDYHPGFDSSLKDDMRAETHEFFGLLVRKNLSALNLVDSDFSMLNERLARHYRIDGVFGTEFRKVALNPEQHRGGLLGQGSILLANSTGEDSHAIRRAVFIRDRLLNDPPAPPPPDVPALAESNPDFHKLSIREQLKIHRGTKACASCHKDIDPWGIALENFDAVGLWRTEIRRRTGRKKFHTIPVNASDILPDGTRLDGIDSLKQHLLTKKKDQFARSLVARLLTYALGRRLELSDEAAIDLLTAQFAKSGYRLRELITQIVLSELFRTK